MSEVEVSYTIDREMIEVTLGGSMNWPADVARQFLPGPWEGTVTVTKEGVSGSLRLSHDEANRLAGSPDKATAKAIWDEADPGRLHVEFDD